MQNCKGEKKQRAFQRLLGDRNSNSNSALSLVGTEFLYYFFHPDFVTWARLGLCFLKKTRKLNYVMKEILKLSVLWYLTLLN